MTDNNQWLLAQHPTPSFCFFRSHQPSAAVTGGLAGMLYGWEEMPTEWINILAGKERIEELIANLQAKFKM